MNSSQTFQPWRSLSLKKLTKTIVVETSDYCSLLNAQYQSSTYVRTYVYHKMSLYNIILYKDKEG